MAAKEVVFSYDARTRMLRGVDILAEAVGVRRAKELSFSARVFRGTEAVTLGVANHAFASKEELDAATDELAAKIAANSRAAVAAMKDLYGIAQSGVGVEAGLFHAEAARGCVQSGLAPRCLRLMLEPGGGELQEVLQRVAEMEAILDAARPETPRLLHGGGATSWDIVDEAARTALASLGGYDELVGARR